MLTSLPAETVLFTSQCLHIAINIKKGCWGETKLPQYTIVFPFNRGNYPQDLGRTVTGSQEGGWWVALLIKLLKF